MIGQYTSARWLPIHCHAFAGGGDLDDLCVVIKAGFAAKCDFIVAAPDFKIAPGGKGRHIAAFRLEAGVGDA